MTNKTLKNITLPGSKSVTNRLLILQAFFPNIYLENISHAIDSVVLQKALHKATTSKNKHIDINIGHAGTAMRFLTTFLSTQVGKSFILDGSERMRQRPIKILVDALIDLGADIEYVDKIGFPPLRINGKKIEKNQIEINSEISSQYISALMLIAPKLPNGLNIILKGKSVSTPYIRMTFDLIKFLGIPAKMNHQAIEISFQKEVNTKHFNIESDWSAASYFYGALTVLRNQKMQLKFLEKNSLQGDAHLVKLFEKFGILTTFLPQGKVEISIKPNFSLPNKIVMDLLAYPDLAQTFAVLSLALKIPCELTGLQTLKIKETDRLQALKNEMEKLGASVKITDDSLQMTPPSVLNNNVSINTYNDHRMAMAFAILHKAHPIEILDKEVVVKSFPNFWEVFDTL